MSKNKYFWQGESVKAIFGYSRVTPNLDKPLYWYNYDCFVDDKGYTSPKEKPVAIIPAIKIEYDNGSFVIANMFGQGWHKLVNGGWPSHSHYSLPDEGFHKSNKYEYALKEFDEEVLAEYRVKADAWFKKTYPEEYEKMQRFKKLPRII